MIFTIATFTYLLLAPSIVRAAAIPSAIIDTWTIENLASYISTSSASDQPPDKATTYNDLSDGKCGISFTLLFARGTNGTGNVGTDVAPSLIRELTTAVGSDKFIVQGTNNYPATIPDYLLGGSNTGAASMAEDVKRAAKQCPGSKIVIAGYSQGAQVVHKAARLIPVSLYSFVSAIVVFGDPNLNDPFPGTLNDNVLSFCHKGDTICQEKLPIPKEEHFTYARDTPEAAAYISAKVCGGSGGVACVGGGA